MQRLNLGDTIKTIINKINSNFANCGGKHTVIFNGSAAIPSRAAGGSTTITLTADVTQFDGLIFQRADCDAVSFFIPPTVGQIYKIVSAQADFTQYMEGLNLYECNAEITGAREIKLSNNVYSGIKTSAAARYITGYTDTPMIKVIGVKY